MGCDTKGFVMTEQKNAFEVAHIVARAIRDLIDERAGKGWQRVSIAENARGERIRYAAPSIRMSDSCQMLSLSFIFNGDNRDLKIHFDCDLDGEGCGYKDGSKIILSLGCWGASVEIMTAILKQLSVYGPAYLIDNDCSDYTVQEVSADPK